MRIKKVKLIHLVVFFLISGSVVTAQTGHIQIVGDPEITVFMDGLYKGKTNADMGGLVIENVTAGSHSVKLVKEGFNPQEEKVLVKSGEVFLYKTKTFITKSQQELDASVSNVNVKPEQGAQEEVPEQEKKDNKADNQATETTRDILFNPEVEYGKFTDPRDGKVYKTIDIGEGRNKRTWMAENLAYKTNEDGCYAYGNNPENARTYGYLYNWEIAMKVCPVGWHLPSRGAWSLLCLSKLMGGKAWGPLFAGENMKETGIIHWKSPNVATNRGGFTALPGGYHIHEGYFKLNEAAWWWSAEIVTGTIQALAVYVNHNEKEFKYSNELRNNAFSVRCVKD